MGKVMFEVMDKLGKSYEEFGVLNKGVSNTVYVDVLKMNVPEPKTFAAARDAKELEKLLLDMKEYLKVVQTPPN